MFISEKEYKERMNSFEKRIADCEEKIAKLEASFADGKNTAAYLDGKMNTIINSNKSNTELVKKKFNSLEEKTDKLSEKSSTVENLTRAISKELQAIKNLLIPQSKKAPTQKEIMAAKKYEKELSENIKKVVKITGQTEEEAKEKFEKAKKLTGCAPKEYFLYKFYELSDEEQDKFFLVSHSRQIRKKFDTDMDFFHLLSDKARTNIYFSEFIRRPWCVNTNVDFEEFKTIFKDSPRVIYKPLSGHCGYGVKAFDLSNDAAMEESYNEISTCPNGVVEEYIVQHPDMMKLAPSSVNSLRIVTISSNKKKIFDDGKTYDIVYAGLRIGQGKSIVDNFHSGGMVANVDLETGVIINNAADQNGNVFVRHPDTDMPIKGFKIPYFEEAVNMVKEAIEKNKIEGYIGWDIAISEKGPMFLEVNAAPGVVILQTAAAQEGKGMKYLMEKYINA